MADRVIRRGDPLSTRELEVVRLVGQGLSNAAIGEALGLTAVTVRSHLERIGAKLGTGDRAGVVGAAFLTGQLPVVRSGPAVALGSDLTRVLIGIARGRTNGQIETELMVSEHKLKNLIRALYRELGVASRPAAVRAGVECGALTLVPRQAPGRPAEASGRRYPSGARKAATEASSGRVGAIASERTGRGTAPVPLSAPQAPGGLGPSNGTAKARKSASVALRPSPGAIPSDAQVSR